MVLLGILFFDSGFKSSHTQVITITQSSLIYSTDDNTIPFTGRKQDTLYNKVILEFDVVEGFKEGEFVIRTLDNILTVRGHMKKNKNHGMWNYYYDDGNLECSGMFNNDQPSGNWKWFYNSGVKMCEGNFINGKEAGTWMEYNEEGILTKLINYRAGEIISLFKIDTIKNV